MEASLAWDEGSADGQTASVRVTGAQPCSFQGEQVHPTAPPFAHLPHGLLCTVQVVLPSACQHTAMGHCPSRPVRGLGRSPGEAFYPRTQGGPLGLQPRCLPGWSLFLLLWAHPPPPYAKGMDAEGSSSAPDRPASQLRGAEARGRLGTCLTSTQRRS